MTGAVNSFEAHRGHLLGIAYRMLGEMAAAEDVVQEAWIRWQRNDAEQIRDLRAWLSNVTMRLALDALRSARARREHYVGPWLPEPILPDDVRVLSVEAPDTRAELASDLSVALLHVLERLSPEERAAFILHDAFDCDYPEIASTLDKSEVACRKLVSRAREHVRRERPRFSVSEDQHRALLARFAQAAMTQDTATLMQLLAPEAVFYSDGGGRAKAALLPVRSADKVARLIAGLMRKSQLGMPDYTDGRNQQPPDDRDLRPRHRPLDHEPGVRRNAHHTRLCHAQSRQAGACRSGPRRPSTLGRFLADHLHLLDDDMGLTDRGGVDQHAIERHCAHPLLLRLFHRRRESLRRARPPWAAA